MIKTQLKIVFAATLIIVLFSCGNNREGYIRVPVNITSVTSIDIHSSKIIESIPLEFSEESEINGISKFEIYNDTIFVLSRGRLLSFNRAGIFLSQIGEAGIFSFFIDNGELVLNYKEQKRIDFFSTEGEFLKRLDLDSYPTLLSVVAPLDVNGERFFVAKNGYMGTRVSTPLFSLFDSDFHNGTGSDINQTNSAEFTDILYPYDNILLYWEVMNDTIYEVNSELQKRVRYFVDFGKHTFPSLQDGKNDPFERIQIFNVGDNRDNYAALINNVREDDNYLYFCYQHKYGLQFITRFDKKRGKSEVFFVVDAQREEGVSFNHLFAEEGDLFIPAVRYGVNNGNPVIHRIRLK